MKPAVLAVLALLPVPAFAGFECKADRQCGGGTCEPYPGGPFVIEQTGDTWESRYDDFGIFNRSTDHETEKEAVISLIHKMELKLSLIHI